MTSPDMLAVGLRAHAQGLCCLQAAADLLIAQDWLRRDDFTSRFITIHPGIGSGHPVAVIDWPAAIAALGSSLPSSGGEQRMLKITASVADGIPVDLRDTLTGLDQRNLDLVVTAVRHAAGSSPQDRTEGDAMLSVCLRTPDAEELADFLRFLSQWLTADPDRLGDSLDQFMSDHPYSAEELHSDLARFSALLGTADSGIDF